MIKLGELVMILDLHRQGLSVSAIATWYRRQSRPTGLEPPVCKNGYQDRALSITSKPICANDWLPTRGLTAVRLWRQLKERGLAGD